MDIKDIVTNDAINANDANDNNDKDGNDDKGISALGLDRDMGFSRGHQGRHGQFPIIEIWCFCEYLHVEPP